MSNGFLNRRSQVRILPGAVTNAQQTGDDSQSREVRKALKKQGDTASEGAQTYVGENPPSTPMGDCTKSADVPHPDKLDDKLISTNPSLTKVVEAWPNLPEAIRTAIIVMVQAAGVSGKKES